MNKISSNPYLVKLTLIATLGGLLFGYDTAVISGTVSSLKHFFIDPYAWPGRYICRYNQGMTRC